MPETSKIPAEKIFLNRENGWNRFDPAEEAALERYCAEYLQYISSVKTERESHDAAVRLAGDRKYRAIENRKKLKPGDKVFRSFNGKTILCAHIGKRGLADGMHILGGHTDSPRLDTKPMPLYEDSGIALLDTHYYGGIRKYHWVALPLAMHGVVVRQDGSLVPVVLGENPDEPVLAITDLLPHLAKDQSKKTLTEAITGEALNVLFGSRPVPKSADEDEDKSKKKRRKKKDEEDDGGPGGENVKRRILQLLRERYGIVEEDLITAELEIVPAGPGRELGLDRSMLLAYAQDDRVCSYAALRALMDLEETPEYTCLALMCDREEIGSVGATGMDSTFFENTVAELLERTQGYCGLTLRRAMERSRMLSTDVCALHDPNYPEVSSPNNMPRLNGGMVVTKYHGARGKAGSSEASAEFFADVRRIFNQAGVIWQTGELGKVDQGGGGTIAMFLARYGMDVIDCGVGLLSMHAPWEVSGKLDVYMAYKGYQAFLADTHGSSG